MQTKGTDRPARAGEADERLRSEQAFLAEASRLLASSIDYETTLATVAEMALPHLGSWCFVDVLKPGEEMRRLAVVHPDPEMQALARRLERGWPPERDDPVGIPRAVRTRRSEILPEVPDDLLVDASRTEENLEILRRLGIGSLMIVPLIAHEQVLGAITYVSPRGGRRYTEEDLELAEDLAARCALAIESAQLYREARWAQAEAEEANRAKSEFMATMSHEIRTPINAVIGYVDLLEAGIAGPLSEKQVQYLERVKLANRHLLGLVNDILDMAKVDAGQLQVHPEDAAAGPVVDAALDMVRSQVEGRALSLSESCEGEAGARFHADVDRVRQIVVNLLSNAVKFTPDGGTIRVSCGHTTAPPEGMTAAAISDDWTCIQVEDTGIGMERGTLEQLFEPFMQADTGFTKARQGTGLGLAISRRLAREMGGDLTVESTPGEGSTFTLWLPMPEARPGTPPLPGGGAGPRHREPVHGVAGIGKHMLSTLDGMGREFVEAVRERGVVPPQREVTDSEILDHAISLIADLAQSLVLLEESTDDSGDLLRDGSAIQRTIADRHGLQRYRIGWTVEALDREFDLLGEEIRRVAREAGRNEDVEVDRALELLDGFLQQARRGSLRAFRMAAQRTGGSSRAAGFD